MTTENRNLTIDERYFGVQEYAEISAAMKVLYEHGVHFKAWLPADFEHVVGAYDLEFPGADSEEVVFAAYSERNYPLIHCQDSEWDNIDEELRETYIQEFQQEKI